MKSIVCDIRDKDLSLSFLAPSGGNSFTHPRPSSLAHRSVGWIRHRPRAVLTRIKHPPDHLLFSSPRCPRTGAAGKSSEACHLEDDSHPQPAHPDTSGAATGLRGHRAVLSFSLWKQTPAEIEGAESTGGHSAVKSEEARRKMELFQLESLFCPCSSGRKEEPQSKHAEDRKRLSPWTPSSHQRDFTSLCPQKGQTDSLCCDQTSQQVADYTRRPHRQQVLNWTPVPICRFLYKICWKSFRYFPRQKCQGWSCQTQGIHSSILF